MKILVFLTNLGLGGTEKAACRWAWGLKERSHQVEIFTMEDGPRRAELEQHSIPARVVGSDPVFIAKMLKESQPDIIHAHAPGHPFPGDVLGEALAALPKKIPVIQTNVFGHLWNPKENAWTDFRLFISWTSCVQAARRVCLRLDGNFFQRNSVAVYPLDASEPSSPKEVAGFRHKHGVADGEILFGRFSRPEPNKWTNLAVDAFRLACKKNPKIKLLLREPPPLIAEDLRQAPDAGRFLILPATGDTAELRLTMSAIDIGLHTSSIGESFGYGIAELMNLGKPVITHSVPWHDQAQIELVRHGECGFIASTPAMMAKAILALSGDPGMRTKMGQAGRDQVRQLADPVISIARMEKIFQAVLSGGPNPFASEDLRRAIATAGYLDSQQFGHSLLEQLALRPFYYRVRFNQLRKSFRSGTAA